MQFGTLQRPVQLNHSQNHYRKKSSNLNLPEHWRYSSASNYAGLTGLIEMDSWVKATLERLRLHSHAGAWERYPLGFFVLFVSSW